MIKRRLPIGAELLSKGGVHFRVWAPRREKVYLVSEIEPRKSGSDPKLCKEMIPEPKGYFSVHIPEASGGALYRFKLDDDEKLYPDPASRYQPDGPEGHSQVVDPFQFQWTDHEWRGVKIDGQVIYEMHIGTFTREGTWSAACEHLKELAETGVTLLEIMPVADFGGSFGWGYDGVNMYAPSRLYGSPEDFRRFVDHAHSVGLGVILDVVYNHFGPVGNYISQFSIDYFTDRYETDWGYALNFDGKNSGPVREFFIQNAVYWISEFHLDGLRIDATQSIIDKSPNHVLSELTKKVRGAVKDRAIVIIAENEPQDARLVRAIADGGFGLDGIWNDDFHHSAMVALTGRNEAYYTDYFGKPQEFISAAKWGFLYQSQYYTWQKKRRGTPALGLKPAVFINYIQNHDQVANSAQGKRCHFLTSPAKHRAITAFFLLIAGTPMLLLFE